MCDVFHSRHAILAPCQFTSCCTRMVPLNSKKGSLCAARLSNKRNEQKHEPNNGYSVVWRRGLDVLPLKEWCIHQRPTPLNMEGRTLAHLSVSEHTTETIVESPDSESGF